MFGIYLISTGRVVDFSLNYHTFRYNNEREFWVMNACLFDKTLYDVFEDKRIIERPENPTRLIYNPETGEMTYIDSGEGIPEVGDEGKLPEEIVETIMGLKFKELLDFNQLPALDYSDTLLVVSNKSTGRVSVDQFMQYLNENLRNFICWKPVVTEKTLAWERSSNDQAPEPLDFADIIFPFASETDSGVITPEFYIKLRDIDDKNIVYKNELNSAIETRAPKVHTHEQYQLRSEMPTIIENLRGEIDTAKNAAIAAIPKNVGDFENDANYITLKDIPSVTINNAGYMTPELLSMLMQLDERSVTQDDIDTAKNAAIAAIPKNVGDFVNNVNYITPSTLDKYIGNIGSVNFISNGEFRMGNSGWMGTNATVESYTSDPDFDYVGKLVIEPGGYVDGTLLYQLYDNYYSASLFAKAEQLSNIEVRIGSVIIPISIGTVWKQQIFPSYRQLPNCDSIFRIMNNTESTVTIYITRVQLEDGRFPTRYYTPHEDLMTMITTRATATTAGIVQPDNTSIEVVNGIISVKPNPNYVGAFIDDANINDYETWSSLKINTELNNRAPLSDGKVPSEYLPSFVDDVIEGTMTYESDGTMIFVVADGQPYMDEGPTTAKIYLDTTSNLSYRWTGTTYIQCTTDKLAGNVIVRYNKPENFMYFVFPENA